MSHDDGYVTKMQKKLEEWTAAFAVLATDAATAGTEAKAEFEKRSQGLAAKAEVARAKIAELRLAGLSEWVGLKREVGKLYGELRTTTDRMGRTAR